MWLADATAAVALVFNWTLRQRFPRVQTRVAMSRLIISPTSRRRSDDRVFHEHHRTTPGTDLNFLSIRRICICLSRGDLKIWKPHGSENTNLSACSKPSILSPEPKQLHERRRGRKGRVSKAGLAALNKELYGHIYSCRKTLRRLLTFVHRRWLLVYLPRLLSLLHSFFLFRFIFSATATFCSSSSFTIVSLRPPISLAFLSLVVLFILFYSLHTYTHTNVYEQSLFSFYLPFFFVL